MRILLVEDDPVLGDVMQRSLSQHGHRVDHARTLDEGGHWWRVQPFDAVLLDLNLPRSAARPHELGNGLVLLREARARGDRTPVIVLTARDRTEQRIAGLDAGADDYLGKPFELAEIGQLALDRRAGRVLLAGAPWDLPAREFEVLRELLTPPGRVLSKRLLSDKLSGLDEALGDNALEAFISRLRKKLAGSGARIRTLRGLGYVIEPETP